MEWKRFSARWPLALAAVASVSAFYLGRSVERHANELFIRDKSTRFFSSGIEAAPKSQGLEDPHLAGSAAFHQAAEKRLFEILEGPLTPSREAELARFFQDLARHDGAYAISLAEAEPNIRLRAELLRSAAKGWGETDLAAAVQWAQTQGLLDRAQAVAAALQGGVRNPENAVRVASALIAGSPAHATEDGNALISALTESAHFERAAAFALSGTGEHREGWILNAFSRWAEFQPTVAASFVVSLTDSDVRESALGALVVGWAPTDPSSLIQFAQQQLTGRRQSDAISQALEFWADRDPASAAKWINEHAVGNAADVGKATLAQSPAFSSNPELALNWASTIDNPDLRSDTLTAVVEKWAATDPARAIAFVSVTATIDETVRSQLLSRLKNVQLN